MVTDSISDLITRMRNAMNRDRGSVSVPYSKLAMSIVEVLKEKTIIDSFEVVEPDSEAKKYEPKSIIIKFAYDEVNGRKENRISNITRVSKPGMRSYYGYKKMPKVRSGYGVSIVSTSKGIMTDIEARREKLGGEILFNVW